MENQPLHEAYERRKERCDQEKWRIATLNINGAPNAHRAQRLKRELALTERRIDIAFLQETLNQDTVDQLHDYTV